jgi:hypothetical protein
MKPGRSAIQLVATAIENKVRSGASRVSMKYFVWPDYRVIPALVHPGGKGYGPQILRSRPSRRG